MGTFRIVAGGCSNRVSRKPECPLKLSRTAIENGTTLPARPHQLKFGGICSANAVALVNRVYSAYSGNTSWWRFCNWNTPSIFSN